MNRKSLSAPSQPDESAAVPLTRISDRLNRAIDAAAAPARLAADGREVRSDGWTPWRIRAFLEALADTGVVSDAARAAGISVRGAYGFRERREGSAFKIAWDAALELGRQRLADAMMSRALHGCVELIVRDGEVWGERHRYDNRTSLSVLSRLDQKRDASRSRSSATRLVVGEFDRFVDIVCAGGEAAGDFLKERAMEEGLWGAEQEEALSANVKVYFSTDADEHEDESREGPATS